MNIGRRVDWRGQEGSEVQVGWNGLSGSLSGPLIYLQGHVWIAARRRWQISRTGTVGAIRRDSQERGSEATSAQSH